MSIIATIPQGRTEITVNGLHQWDYGQTLEIHDNDLPAMIEVHFACAGMEAAVVRSCQIGNGIGVVSIPDQCLEQSSPILAWIYVAEGTGGCTLKTITLTVIPRTKPQYPATIPEDSSDAYTEAVAAMNELVEEVRAGNIRQRHAEIADFATEAGNANLATYASNAGTAEYANRAYYAENADNSLHAGLAEKAREADTATSARTADSAIEAGNANWAATANEADSAVYLRDSNGKKVLSGDALLPSKYSSWGAYSNGNLNAGLYLFLVTHRGYKASVLMEVNQDKGVSSVIFIQDKGYMLVANLNNDNTTLNVSLKTIDGTTFTWDQTNDFIHYRPIVLY